MHSLRRHMTILERRKLREEILAKELARAHRQAARAGLTMKCEYAMRLTGSDPAGARRLHADCKGEEPPRGAGCLCFVTTSSVRAWSPVTSEVLFYAEQLLGTSLR
jgi:hypothetical protein